MHFYSKLNVARNKIIPIIAMQAAAVTMSVVVNSTRKRRREGGHVYLASLPPGGLGSNHSNKKRPTARYVFTVGKAD